jgi:acetolactate synthase-1/2/3 large subunit
MSTAIHVIPEPLPTTSETRYAAYLLADYLERLGVEVVFGLTGHTVIGMLDALGRSRIRYVSTRHEQVAAHAADGYARATGKPGVLLTHLGPGLTNAATGVANAALDSIPMVVIAGDVQSYFHGRHPHQEVNLHQDADQFQIYRPFCKRVYRVGSPGDLPRIMERAFHLAQSGRPGPVLVDVPMDIFSAALPVDAFSKVPAAIARPVDRRGDRRAHRRDARRGGAARALRGGRRPVGAIIPGARRARGRARASDRAFADGERGGPRGSSAAARDDRLLGNPDRE